MPRHKLTSLFVFTRTVQYYLPMNCLNGGKVLSYILLTIKLVKIYKQCILFILPFFLQTYTIVVAMAAQPPDPVYILRGSTSSVTSLHFPASSSDFLYAGNETGHVLMWDMKNKRIQSSLDAHGGRSVLWIDFLDDSHMVTQGRDGNVQFWASTDSQWRQTGILSVSLFY